MNKPDYGPVWVVAEASTNGVKELSLQLLGKGRELADQLQVPLESILLGQNPRDLSKSLIAAGADRVYLGDDPQFSFYQQELYSTIIFKLAKEHHPEILLFGSTHIGRELAPLVAARLGTGLSAHCIDLVINDDNNLEQIVPAYGGLITIICPQKRPQMATVAHGIFPVPLFDECRDGELKLIKKPVGIPKSIEIVEVIQNLKEDVSLESADVIVAGGAGAEDIEGWGDIADLARILNGGLGSTRPAVDGGWTELETMIGQSGKIVNPKFYIGVGISGELQHMVGIVGAKTMVAINNDPKAPIFEQVDYGIVENCREFLPVLIKKLKDHTTKKNRDGTG